MPIKCKHQIVDGRDSFMPGEVTDHFDGRKDELKRLLDKGAAEIVGKEAPAPKAEKPAAKQESQPEAKGDAGPSMKDMMDDSKGKPGRK